LRRSTSANQGFEIMAGQTRFKLGGKDVTPDEAVKVKRDELVEVSALMLPQYERVAGSLEMQRRMPKKFECKIGGQLVFSAEFGASSTTSAYVQFKIKVRESALVVAMWTNFDDKAVPGGSAEIRVI
jgi:hypothetical protein